MPTLLAQSAVALGLLIFASVAALVAARLPAGEPVFRYGWAFTATTFLIQGLNMAVHCALAILAFQGGSGSPPWNAILVWHPILNHSRTFLLTAYCVVLSLVLMQVRRKRPLPPLWAASAAVLAGMVLGGIVGWHEEAFSGLTHFSAVAVFDIMELLALMTVLFVGLLTGGMDRGLWAALAVNAFVLALSVLWFASLSRIDVAGQWSPRPSHIHLAKAALYLVMVGIACRQWKHLRNGRRVRSFFEAGPRAVPSLHG